MSAVELTYPKTVIVTGSRIWLARNVLFRALSFHQPTLVVHGACRDGADAMAEAWAKQQEVDYRGMPARWRPPSGYDKAAGFKRNGRMLAEYPGALVLAFPEGEARGTSHCIRTALAMGHVVWVYDHDGKVRLLPECTTLEAKP